jgi:hypothetical protein
MVNATFSLLSESLDGVSKPDLSPVELLSPTTALPANGPSCGSLKGLSVPQLRLSLAFGRKVATAAEQAGAFDSDLRRGDAVEPPVEAYVDLRMFGGRLGVGIVPPSFSIETAPRTHSAEVPGLVAGMGTMAFPANGDEANTAVWQATVAALIPPGVDFERAKDGRRGVLSCLWN